MGKKEKKEIREYQWILYYLPVLLCYAYVIWFSFSKSGLAVIHSDLTVGIQKMEEALREHNFLPYNWYYANTMNFPWGMDIQIVFYFLTKNYLYSLILCRIFWMIMMSIILFVFGNKVMKLGHKYLAFCLCAILSPISGSYFMSLEISGYNRRIFIWFLLLSLGLFSLEEDSLKPQWKFIVPFCLLLIAYMTGDSRYIAILIIPLLASYAICYVIVHRQDDIKVMKKPVLFYTGFSVCLGICVLICRGIEHLLSRSHTLASGYYDANILSLDDFQQELVNRIVTVVKEFMEGFGYIGDAPLISKSSVLSFAALFFMTFIIIVIPVMMIRNYSKYDTRIQRLILVRWIGYAISIYFGIFGLSGISFRHFLPYVILDYFLAVYYLSNHWMQSHNIGYAVGWAVMIIYLLTTWADIPELAPASLTDDRYGVIEELKNRGLTYGYGEYWSASVIQTFSNDELRILPCLPEDRMEWYCPKELYLPADAEESTFYITDVDSYSELETDENFQKIYGDYTEKLEIGNYVVLIYNYNIVHNFHEYRSQGGFNLVKYLYSSAPDARDSRNAVYIAPGEYVYGPYMILDAGDYKLHVEVNEACECKVYSHDGEILPLTQLKAGENILNISIDKDDTFAIEVWIQNTQNQELIVEKMVVE